MRAYQNTWGRVSQVLRLGYERYVAVHAWHGMGNGSRMPADVQASMLDLTACTKVFPTQNAEADDGDVI